jgi:shikimate kinase
MNTSNVILIGMSGAGKSTLGVLLAKALGKHFVDTDILIQQSTGKLLQEIIDGEGTARFLEIEEEILSSQALTNTVIATGGSAVYSDKAMKALKQNGIAVYLQVEFDALAKRLSNITTRGIVFKGSADLQAVYAERLPLYEQYADITVPSTDRDIESTLAEIIDKIKE